MQYNATIHTLTITPTIHGTVPTGSDATAWIKNAYSADHPCVNQLNKPRQINEPRVTINPHKLNRNADGKFIFDYMGMEEYRQTMRRICNDLGADGYIIRRIDLCLDTDSAYADTEKFIRLIMLMLSEEHGLMNRYASIDPLTMKPKSTTMKNGSKPHLATMEIEHYNRALVDQSNWAEPHVINRFELRLMGAQAGTNSDEESIVGKWLEYLAALQARSTASLEQKLNDGLMREWEHYAAMMTASNEANPKTIFNYFIRGHAESVFTRSQLKDLFRRFGSKRPEIDAQNLLQRSGSLFMLFKPKDIRAGIQPLLDALNRFKNAKTLSSNLIEENADAKTGKWACFSNETGTEAPAFTLPF